jgi:hypothetical protein
MAEGFQFRDTVPKIMVGSSKEVSDHLCRNASPSALAVTFADDDQRLALEAMFRRVTAFLPQLVRQRQRDKVDQIVEALLPDIETAVTAMAPVRMLVNAKAAILRSGDFLRASEIAEMAGYSPKNLSAQPNKWKRDEAIFACQYKGVDYFPRYALDSLNSYRPYKALVAILKRFGETKSGWSAAFWFAGLNSFLDGQRPQDLLATRPDLVIAAAQDEVDGVQHG